MKKNKGFTLIELLAVIVILGILLSLSIVSVNGIRKNQEEENKENIIISILTGAKRYATDNNMSTESIEVSDLVDEYVSFDQDKYQDLYNKTVSIESCGDENGLKRKFSITVDGKTYNDCGCQEQASNTSSDKICTK